MAKEIPKVASSRPMLRIDSDCKFDVVDIAGVVVVAANNVS